MVSILTFSALAAILNYYLDYLLKIAFRSEAPVSNLDPLNMFWKTCMNMQEVNQLALKAFVNTQKVQQSQYLMEQFVQECMAYVGDNSAVAIKLFQSLSAIKTPEDFSKLQEKILAEYTEKNIEHIKKILGMYNNLIQENYRFAKENAEDLTNKFTNTANELVKNCTDNVNKFAEVNPFIQNTCSAKNTKRHSEEKENR